MKKRIYKINNKNLVTGNPNEVTENEILVKENNDGTVELSHRNNGTLETLGSGSNGGGNASIEYIDLSQLPDDSQLAGEIMLFSILIKYTFMADSIDGLQTGIKTPFFLNSITSLESIKAVAIDVNLRLYDYITGYNTIKDFLMSIGIYENYSNLPRLTKEEFYGTTLPTE